MTAANEPGQVRAGMPDGLARAHRIVADAAACALEAFNDRGNLRMRAKGPQDFVSAADEKVEQLIRARLALEFFGDAVIGEEGGGWPSANATWFIDPIDGTSNFLRGLPLWGVSLGLVRGGKPSIGVIAFPALDLIVGAEAGFGLFVNGLAAQPQRPFGDVHLASVGDADLDLEDALATTRRLREAGWVVESYRCTTLGLAFSALGRLDGHLQHRVQAWDIAAGLVLCAEAGLEVHHGPLDERPTWVRAGLPEIHRITRAGWVDAGVGTGCDSSALRSRR
ncbi:MULTISPECIES: inositol monophosphatase family protein [unclassified Variovorax]|uniref:inositol monophosphatase family protein n=2 Tax=Variovorax TaxID=34072 RepID=UPI003F48CFFA